MAFFQPKEEPPRAMTKWPTCCGHSKPFHALLGIGDATETQFSGSGGLPGRPGIDVGGPGSFFVAPS